MGEQEFQGALWATYTMEAPFMLNAEIFFRAQYTYTGESHTLLVPEPLTDSNPSFDNDSIKFVRYSGWDARYTLHDMTNP